MFKCHEIDHHAVTSCSLTEESAPLKGVPVSNQILSEDLSQGNLSGERGNRARACDHSCGSA